MGCGVASEYPGHARRAPQPVAGLSLFGEGEGILWEVRLHARSRVADLSHLPALRTDWGEVCGFCAERRSGLRPERWFASN
jgi:hypothetical protein